MTSPRQGEIWWAEAEDKRRPVLVITRSEAVPVLTWIVVAPVTRTIRGIPTEIRLGPAEGLTSECAASFDNLQPIREPSWWTAPAPWSRHVVRRYAMPWPPCPTADGHAAYAAPSAPWRPPDAGASSARKGLRLSTFHVRSALA